MTDLQAQGISGWTVQDILFTDVLSALACELDLLAQALTAGPQLLFWELETYAVVLGYGRIEQADVNLEACVRDHVPVVRRRSGGGTVLLGPGCLCYSLIMPLHGAEHLADIQRTNRWVLERAAAILTELSGVTVGVSGISDLTLGQRKIGGSAQRRTREAVLWHGTLLYDFDLTQIAAYLREPDRQPEYRRQRSHAAFVSNLPVHREQAVLFLTQAFDAQGKLGES